MTKSIGSALKEARGLISMTLRQVEVATGISNAYLSQLENDKIKKPSANVLYKLSSIYKIDLNSLLRASGIIKKSDLGDNEATSDFSNNVAFYSSDLSEDDQRQILEYIKYLKFKSNNAG